jgi:hypothetical protein
MVKNENFIKFSNCVENSWLKYLSSLITIFIARYFIFGAICQRFYFEGKWLLIIMASIFSIWLVVDFSNNNFLIMWYGYIVMVLVGFFYNNGRKRFLGLLAIVLELAFSTICMLTRNIQLTIIDNYIIYFIGSIDLYIMFIMYYLYSNLLRLGKEV